MVTSRRVAVHSADLVTSDRGVVAWSCTKYSLYYFRAGCARGFVRCARAILVSQTSRGLRGMSCADWEADKMVHQQRPGALPPRTGPSLQCQ